MKYPKCSKCGHHKKLFDKPHDCKNYVSIGYAYYITIHPLSLICCDCIKEMAEKINKALYETT